MKFYERTSTTVMNAYLGPILRAYLGRLQQRLDEAGYTGPVLIMQSNGGVTALAAQRAVLDYHRPWCMEAGRRGRTPSPPPPALARLSVCISRR